MSEFAHYLPFLVIPILTAGIGWSTNWLGIKMMMHPIERIGIGPLGWQGIIPRVRVRMTRAMVENCVKTVCTPREMLEAVDDSHAIESITELISPQIKDWTDEILSDQVSRLWNLAPSLIKKAVYREVEKQLPHLAEDILEELKGRMSYLIDIGDIAAIESEKKPTIFPRLMNTIAAREFTFVVRSGLYLGFPLGCIQALVWYIYPMDLVLPLFGLIVGALTNWLALQVLVRPSDPVRIMGIRFQGLFIARQQTVARDFAEGFTRDFVDINTVFDYAWNGKNSEEVRALVRRQLIKNLNEKVLTGPIYKALVLSGQSKKLDRNTLNILEDKIGVVLQRPGVDDKLLMPIRELMAERMAGMPPVQFQGLLMPIFEEDQWILIAIGGLLGFLAGLAQLVFIFGGSLFS
jgi:uncharacterized membrane protein YheB (UPF0754 family)